MKAFCKPLVMLCGAALLTSCVAGTVTKNDLDAVYGRISNNEKQIRDINNQLGMSGNVVPGQAEMWSQMQAMRQEINLIKGQLADMGMSEGAGNASSLQSRVNSLDSAMRRLSAELAIDPAAIGLGDTGSTPPTPAVTPGADSTPAVAPSGNSPTPVSAPPVSTSQDSSLAEKLYKSGTQAFSDRRYNDAVKIFTDFVETYKQHELLSNSYFWQGESYYQLKNYNNAILSYQNVIEKFPGSSKLQSAMYKQGISLYYNGQKDAGKIRLNELVRKFPQSQEADRAKRFLNSNS